MSSQAETDREYLFDRALFDLDANKLEIDWMEQPKLMRIATQNAADIRLDLAEAKAELEVALAKGAYSIRTDPSQYGLDKVTETAIKELLTDEEVFPKITKLHDKIRQLTHAEDLWKGLIASLSDRKAALENLVKLHGQGYFSTPYVAGPAGQKMDDSTKKSVRRPVKKKVK
jgi:hypothetical protein